ncbi:uncharacterized protein BYT42DRAFT_551580 [Radiomyces spectabilis]|uniref:uncharacterized protein n=1 Tax=Radiomyces spectabilis TaxID=64574 RepID=UPI00221F70B9|nr:uncharacterized protein BYT42DRAFT_551580 [Radiomyces spectabilis]KAI8393589.1 hypothetical protein BYT42DRAFT_551580 [Radiomyces spectabilis]
MHDNKLFNSSDDKTSSLILYDASGDDIRCLFRKAQAKRNTLESPYCRDNCTTDIAPYQLLHRPAGSSTARRFLGQLFSVMFSHEDRYFNNDRTELSKDIFPA